MRATTLLRALLGLKHTSVTGFEFTSDELVVDVCPAPRHPHCSGCGQRRRRCYDGRLRLWRHLDILGLRVLLRYRQRRVDCPRCGVTTELLPWAEVGSCFTRAFEDVVAYLAQRTDKTTVADMMRIAWRTVGNIIERVVARIGARDLLDDLTHVGIDELSYRRHHKYITIVTDHVGSRIVWAAEGKNADTVREFFAALGPERVEKLKAVTIDMSQAYVEAVRECAPKARLVFDRFHVQRLAHDALDKLRREQVRELAGAEAKDIKRTRWSLQKRPWNLTQPESEKLAVLQRRNRSLFRGYLMKEALATILDGRQVNVARDRLHDWIGWAARSRLEPFRKVARTVKQHIEGIVAYVATGLSNGPAEGMNGKVRTITRRAYGFHRASSLIALLFLCCSGIVLMPLRRWPDPRLVAAPG
jgi:transposase